MPKRRRDLEQMRLRLHRELDRSGSLADPEVLKMAQRLDCLIVEEMKKALPAEEPAGRARRAE